MTTDSMSMFLRLIRDERIWLPSVDDLSTKLSWISHSFSSLPTEMQDEALQILVSKMRVTPGAGVRVYFQKRNAENPHLGIFRTDRYPQRLLTALSGLRTELPNETIMLDLCYTLPNRLSVRTNSVSLRMVLGDAEVQKVLEDLTGVQGDTTKIVRRCCEFAHLENSESYKTLMSAIAKYCSRRFQVNLGPDLTWSWA